MAPTGSLADVGPVQGPHDASGGPAERAVRRYPKLRGLGLESVRSYGAQPYKLETWLPGESGTRQEPRPAQLPQQGLGVQVFDRSVTPQDVYADVASHYLRQHDQALQGYYTEFVKTLTPQQEKRLHADYRYSQQNEGTTMPYDQWVHQVRLPAYFRGYVFNQWPQDFNNRVFTPEQKHLLNQVRDYLDVGQR